MNKRKLLIIALASLIPIIQPFNLSTNWNFIFGRTDAVIAKEKGFDFYYEEGKKYYEKDNYEKAIEFFDKAISINSTNPDIFFERGYSKEQFELYKEAENDYSRAIELDPQFKNAYLNRAYARINQEDIKKFEIALQDFKKYIEIEPIEEENLNEYIAFHYSVANSYSYKNKNKKAVKIMEQAVDLDEGNGNSFFWLGVYKILSGNHISGCKYISKSRKMKASEYDPSWLKICK